LNHFKTYSI